jgi:trehalose-6-phosphatase
VQWLVNSMKERPNSIAYFGDDTTDEDAFFELRTKGVTILVGGQRRSWARYHTAGPLAVAAVLQELVTKLERPAVVRRSRRKT